MVSVIVATSSDVKKKAFEDSLIASYLRDTGVKYEFVECNGHGDEFAGKRWPQPFTASGGILAAMQRISDVKKDTTIRDSIFIKHYDESGMLIGTERKDVHAVIDSETIIIAIENYVTDNAKDCVCIVVNYYVDGKKCELVSFSPAAYIASFPEKYLQHLATIEKYQPGVMGFKTTIGEIIARETHNNVCKNWINLFNPFDRVEQIRETLNYIADEFKKICVLVR